MKAIYGKKCLVDTNILLFARDKASPYHHQAANIFQNIAEGKFEAYISYQNLMEYGAVLTRLYKVTQKETAKDIEMLLSDSNITVIYPSPNSAAIFLKMLKEESGVYIFDLFLAATAISAGIKMIVSDDHDFRKIKEISLFNPIEEY